MEHGKPYALLNKVSNREGRNCADGKEEAKSKRTTVMVVIGVYAPPEREQTYRRQIKT